MPKIIVYINDDLHKRLTDIKEKSNESFSKIVADIIESGCKVKELNKKEKLNKSKDKMLQLESKSIKYLLRIISITSDIYRCTRNKKSRHEAKDADGALKEIAAEVEAFINENTPVNQ